MAKLICKSSENVCRDLRLQMKYSIGEMALLLGLKKSTYQCYDSGTRETPLEVVYKARAVYLCNYEYWESLKPGGSFYRRIEQDFPNGIQGGV